MNSIPIKSIPIAQKLKELSGINNKVSIADFMDTALYHPTDGYYTKDKNRVGRSSSTDFFTSSNFSQLFGQIVVEATKSILEKNGQSPSEYSWIELGAEPNSELLKQFSTQFKETRSIRVGEHIELGGKLIVFSNELFDAQPCHSIIFDDGEWKERFVTISDSYLSLTLDKISSPELEPFREKLPQLVPQGYIIDIPTRSKSLAEEILKQNWKGAFIAFDYGKTWRALINDTPNGSLRAYKNHRQNPEFLEDAGEQDLTCHICWEFLEETLEQYKFTNIQLESQESFIIKRAPKVLEKAFDPTNNEFSKIRSQLKQLTHPTLMGQKFQAITAFRS